MSQEIEKKPYQSPQAVETRKAYSVPSLTEFGDVARLTLGDECSNGDGVETGDDECP